MKVHKVTLYVIDHDRVGAQGVSDALTIAKYPDRCVSPEVLNITTRDCGKWDDNHPLNHSDKAPAEIARLFAPTLEECEAAGRGPRNGPGTPFDSGGLPDTPEERARFEAYMRGHCWGHGMYNEESGCYDGMFTRQLYGIWRDRGSLAK